jgi:hypothetical protein
MYREGGYIALLEAPGSYCAYAVMYITACLIKIFTLATNTYEEQRRHIDQLQSLSSKLATQLFHLTGSTSSTMTTTPPGGITSGLKSNDGSRNSLHILTTAADGIAAVSGVNSPLVLTPSNSHLHLPSSTHPSGITTAMVSVSTIPPALLNPPTTTQLTSTSVYEFEDMTNLEETEPLFIDTVPTPLPAHRKYNSANSSSLSPPPPTAVPTTTPWQHFFPPTVNTSATNTTSNTTSADSASSNTAEASITTTSTAPTFFIKHNFHRYMPIFSSNTTTTTTTTNTNTAHVHYEDMEAPTRQKETPCLLPPPPPPFSITLPEHTHVLASRSGKFLASLVLNCGDYQLMCVLLKVKKHRLVHCHQHGRVRRPIQTRPIQLLLVLLLVLLLLLLLV